MALLVKCLPYTHKDPSSNLGHQVGMVVGSAREAVTGKSLGLGSQFFQIGELEML